MELRTAQGSQPGVLCFAVTWDPRGLCSEATPFTEGEGVGAGQGGTPTPVAAARVLIDQSDQHAGFIHRS